MFGYPLMDLVASALVAVGSFGVSSVIVSVFCGRRPFNRCDPCRPGDRP